MFRPTISRITQSLICFFCAALLLGSCSHSTKPETSSLSGTVQLVNDNGDRTVTPTDMSGVLVSLYKMIEPDSTIIRLRNEYPGLGLVSDNGLITDTRMLTPVKTTLTNEDGSYLLDNLTPDSYLLRFSKNDWGDRHIYDVQVNGNVTLEQVTIYPMVTCPAVINELFTFESGHSYTIESDIHLMQGCVFEGGANLYLENNVNINVHGSIVSSSDDYSRLLPLQANNSFRWNTFNVYASDLEISKLIISGAVTALTIHADNVQISDCYVVGSTNGINVNGTNSSIDRCILGSLTGRGINYYNIEVGSTAPQSLTNCLIYNCENGVHTSGHQVTITNNYLVGNVSGLFAYHDMQTISNNCFDRNDKALICYGTDAMISYNRFFNNAESVKVFYPYFFIISNPLVQNNDFYQTSGYAISLFPQVVNSDINAENNYWRSSSVDSVIFDANDNPNIIYYVDYLPKRTVPIAGAGILDI